jgi:hypothetical protein
MCEAPGMLGNTIGSSGSRWLNGQSARNSETRTIGPLGGGGGGGTMVPWIVIAVALAGAFLLLVVALRRNLRPTPKAAAAP